MRRRPRNGRAVARWFARARLGGSLSIFGLTAGVSLTGRRLRRFRRRVTFRPVTLINLRRTIIQRRTHSLSAFLSRLRNGQSAMRTPIRNCHPQLQCALRLIGYSEKPSVFTAWKMSQLACGQTGISERTPCHAAPSGIASYGRQGALPVRRRHRSDDAGCQPAAADDPSPLDGIAHICQAIAHDPYAQRHHFWMNYVRRQRGTA